MENAKPDETYTAGLRQLIETVTLPPERDGHSPILAGWIDVEVVKTGGNESRIFTGTCERCSKSVSRTPQQATARKDVLKHRRRCYPMIHLPKQAPKGWGPHIAQND